MKTTILSLFMILGLMSSAFADNKTGTSQATATLSSSCQFSSTDVNFGDVTPATTTDIGWKSTTTVTGTLSATCTNGTNYTIALNSGTNNNRTLTSANSVDSIQYTFCRSNAFVGQTGCSLTWSGGSTYSGRGTGLTQSIIMYGFLKKAFVTPANYTDTMTATITY